MLDPMTRAAEPWFAGLEERRKKATRAAAEAATHASGEAARELGRKQLKRELERERRLNARLKAKADDSGLTWVKLKSSEDDPPPTTRSPGQRRRPPHLDVSPEEHARRTSEGKRKNRPADPTLALKRRQLLGQLLANGLAEEDIVVVCLDPKHELGFKRRGQVLHELTVVKHAWAKADQDAAPRLKAMATRRILDHIAKARSKGAWAAVATLERTLADIQGTKAPIRVEVDVTEAQRVALAGALAAMPIDRVLELAQLRRELRAEQERRLLRESPMTIEAKVEEALAEASVEGKAPAGEAFEGEPG